MGNITFEQFEEKLNDENMNYIQDSFNSLEEAYSFYLQCAENDVNEGNGIYSDINYFFSGLRNLNSLEFI